LSWPGDPLFDNPTTKIGVYLAFLRSIDSLAQRRILNPFLPGETLKPLGFEDPHFSSFGETCRAAFIIWHRVL
jgi:hypothetical protein